MPAMQWFRAQDTLAYELEDGTQGLVTKGDVLAGNHELVKRDAAASKADKSRMPLFAPMETGEPAAKSVS